MVKIIEMDERISLEKQLDEDTGPIVFMNKFSVNPNDLHRRFKPHSSFN
jgi:hypothetical protein